MNDQEKGFPFLDMAPRAPKPRHRGLTIISDCGLPLRATEDLLEVAGDIIDWAKFTDHSGTIGRYPASWIKAKTELYRQHSIPTLIGGAVFELAQLQGKAREYLERLPELGFAGAEISEDLIPPLEPEFRGKLMDHARSLGLEVFTEFGRKFPDRPLDLEEAVSAVRADLDRGALTVVIEEAEVLMIRNRGEDPLVLAELVNRVGIESVVFEAKQPEVQAWLIKLLGPEVSLENIDVPNQLPVTTLERMRRGLHRAVGYGFITSLVEG